MLFAGIVGFLFFGFYRRGRIHYTHQIRFYPWLRVEYTHEATIEASATRYFSLLFAPQGGITRSVRGVQSAQEKGTYTFEANVVAGTITLDTGWPIKLKITSRADRPLPVFIDLTDSAKRMGQAFFLAMAIFSLIQLVLAR